MDHDDAPDQFTNEMLVWFDKQLQKVEDRLEPLMVGLSAGERDTFQCAGGQAVTAARKALKVAQEFEYALGIEVDAEGFARELNQHDKALWMLQRIQPFVQKLEDTMTAARFQLFLHTQDVLCEARASEDPGLARAAVALEQVVFPKRNRIRQDQDSTD